MDRAWMIACMAVIIPLGGIRQRGGLLSERASSTTRTAGWRSPPRRLTVKIFLVTGSAGGSSRTPGGSDRAASRGTRVTPAPAATRLSWTSRSVARATTRGTNPARAQARWIISAQDVLARGARNGVSPSEASDTGAPSGTGWPSARKPSGTASRTGSVSSSRRSNSGSSGRGKMSYSCATATSASPRSTAGSDSSGSISSSWSWTCGAEVASAAHAAATTVAATDGKAASATRPVTWSRSAARSASAESSWTSRASVCATSRVAAGVSAMPRPARSVSGRPTSRSSAASCWDTAGAEYPSAVAAAVTDP